MKTLNKKLGKNSGFTLVEMLIVVAIIAILIAVSIPMMNAALEKSRHAVDDANHRDAIALAAIEYLTDPDTAKGTTWYYAVNASKQGKLLKCTDEVKKPADSDGYSAVEASCICNAGNVAPGSGSSSTNKYLKVAIDAGGKVTATWCKADGTVG